MKGKGTRDIRLWALLLVLLVCGARVSAEPVAAAPNPPVDVRALAIGTSSLRIAWEGASSATGYRVYFGTEPDPHSAELYGAFEASARQATLNGLQGGTLYYVYVSAFNAYGESALDSAACVVERVENSRLARTRLTLDCPRLILLSRGATRTLTVSGAEDIRWEATGGGALSIAPNGHTCVLTALSVGTATVSALHPSGASASVTVAVCDTGDLTGENLASVQQRLARHGDMMESDAGGDVIWDLISGMLTQAGMREDRALYIVQRVRSAARLYRDLYVFAFGSTVIHGEATTDERGETITTSYYAPAEGALYMTPSAATDERYAYTFLHETGHGLDYTAGTAQTPLSLSSDVTAMILQDVRDALSERIADAAAEAGVAEGDYDAGRVIDAVMNYRALLHSDEVMATLTDAERAVYEQLTNNVESEMNLTLPRNNGAMVWDAVEGATNFAISGAFGHAYLFSTPAYRQMAYYYYYDRRGNPRITAEPWAEFFSAQVMGDRATIQVNESWLTRTCRYFSETLAPQMLDAFRRALGARAS